MNAASIAEEDAILFRYNMNNFIFKNPTKLIFGKGQIAEISKEIPFDSKIMVTYGGGSIFNNGIYDQVMTALEGRHYIEFGGIESNPDYDTLMKAVRIANDNGVNFLLAVGGGSVIDGTKFIAAAMKYKGDCPWDFMVDQKEVDKLQLVPFGVVLTLPATASEMNEGAVISRREKKEKLAFHPANNFPRFSVLDPQVCFSLPKRQISNGIVDTFCHVLEQYLTYPTNSLLQERFSESILITLKDIGPKLYENSNDYDLCANFMICATMGLNGFTSMGVPQDWATHMIGHELTAQFGLDHAVTLALVGPSLMRVMKEEKREMIMQYGERVWNICEGSEDERVDAAIDATQYFYERVGIKTHLRDYDIGSEYFDEIANRFNTRGWCLGENKTINCAKVIEILQGCL